MKITSTLLLSASLFCFLGCTEDKKTTTETDTATAESLSAPAPVTTPTAISGEATDLNGTNPRATMVIDEAPAAATPAPATGPGLNPPHGQPGHDCAIAVGAPLNSKGNAAAQPAAQPTAPQTTTSQSSSPVMAPALKVPPITTTAPGLNPPHGQPGHDCAIAVGAPLRK